MTSDAPPGDRLTSARDWSPDVLLRLTPDGAIREHIAPATWPHYVLPSQTIGRRLSDIVPADVAGAIERTARLARSSGRTQTTRYPIEVRGEALEREARVVPMADNDVVVILRDVTAETNAERIALAVGRRLDQRLTELRALAGVTAMLANISAPLDELAQQLAQLLPTAWQEPRFTIARITLGDRVYESASFPVTPWVQREEIVTADGPVGTIEIAYAVQPLQTSSPFLDEERVLLSAVAKAMACAVDDRSAVAALKEDRGRMRLLAVRAGGLIFRTRIAAAVPVSAGAEIAFDYVSPAVERLLGISPDAVLARPGALLEAAHQDQRSLLVAVLRGEHTTGSPVIRFDGATGPVDLEFSTTWVADAAGRPVAVEGAARDVTDHSGGADELKALRDVTGAMNDLLFTIDLDGRFVEFYGDPYPVLGLHLAEMQAFVGGSVADLSAAVSGPGTRDAHFEAFARARAGETAIYQWSATFPAGQRTFETRLSPVRDASGAVSMIVGVARDVSALVALQREHATAAESLRAISLATPLPVIVLDQESRVRLWNPAAESLLRVAAADVVGEPLPAFIRGAALARLRTAVERRERVVLEDVPAQTGDAERLTLRVSAAPLSVSSTDVGAVIIIEDVSEHRRRRLAYELLLDLGQRIFRGEPADRMLTMACEHLALLFDLPLVWVGMREPDGRVRVRASGGPEQAYLEDAEYRWDDTPAGRGPAGLAIRTGSPAAMSFDDPRYVPWRDASGRHGFTASLALPIMADVGEVAGVLKAYTRDPAGITPELITVLNVWGQRVGTALRFTADRERLQLQSEAMEAAANAIMVTDLDGHVEWVNGAFTAMTGYTLEEIVDAGADVLRSGEHPQDFFAELLREVQAGRTHRTTVVSRRKDGSLFTTDLTLAPVRDAHGAIRHLVSVQQDVTRERAAEDEVMWLARHDPLTRLPNRVVLRDRLEQAIARGRRTGDRVAVLFLDFDRFKDVNDSLGHSVGDSLLQLASERVRDALRTTDTLARIGGDELIVMLPDIAEGESAGLVANKVLESLRLPFIVEGRQIFMTASIGIAVCPDDGRDAEALIRNADAAMYAAKAAGRDVFRFFTPELSAAATARLTLGSELSLAVQSQQFEAYFQPIATVSARRVVGAEALVRWRHPERGLIGPADFLETAEETGRIIEIGREMLRQALDAVAMWMDAVGRSLVVSVNVSARQVRSGGFLDDVQAALAVAGTETRHLVLELTESDFIESAALEGTLFRSLRDLGVHLALDDFGTGYASLGYLRRLPLNYVKIAQEFMEGALTSDTDRAIARSIVDLGHRLGLTVVAEGVETEEQLAFLEEIGCDLFQGYLLSPPVPSADFPGLL